MGGHVVIEHLEAYSELAIPGYIRASFDDETQQRPQRVIYASVFQKIASWSSKPVRAGLVQSQSQGMFEINLLLLPNTEILQKS